MPEYQVGDRVRAKEAIYEPADDHAPGGYVCGEGDLLIVRKVRDAGQWPLSVSHEDVTDNSFACGLDEVVPDGVGGMETVRFRRGPGQPEDKLCVPVGTAEQHVRAELITSIEPARGVALPDGSQTV